MFSGTLSRTTVAISLVAGSALILVPACSNNSKQAVQKNDEDDQQDDQGDNDGGSDDERPDAGPVAMDAGGDTSGDGSDRDAAADTTPRDASLDVTGRDVSDDEQDSSDKKDSRNFSWEVREGCDVEKGPGDNPSCSEPSSCPGPDNAREPEVTCYNPQYTPAGNNVTLHIYGKHLVKQGGPPREIAVRQAGSSGVGRSNGDITVHSDCHVSATLYLDDSFSSCGEKVEVRLVREQNLEQDGDTFRLEREASDWKEILLTQP
jgi:hypothetical protein